MSETQTVRQFGQLVIAFTCRPMPAPAHSN